MMQDSSKILLRFCLCLVKILQTSTCSRSWQDLGRNLPRSWQDPSKIKILTRSSKIFHDHKRSWQGSQPGWTRLKLFFILSSGRCFTEVATYFKSYWKHHSVSVRMDRCIVATYICHSLVLLVIVSFVKC